MIGNLVGNRAGLVALAILGGSCAHRIDQDAASGRDRDVTGAKRIKLQDGHGTASGIVTYPGGDRVDWKHIELPDSQRGTLDLQLSWIPPRPGLRLAFDVFDDSGHAIAKSAPVATSGWRTERHHAEVRSASIADAQRSYYVRVYAVRRGDAGTYRLAVNFTARRGEPAAEALDPGWIPDPQPLAPDPRSLPPEPVPAPRPPRVSSLPRNCPTPPSINVPACWATMPCPSPPNRLIKSCRAVVVAPSVPRPVTGRIIGKTSVGSWQVITIVTGTNQGIQSDWTATLLRGGTDEAVPGGAVELIRVEKTVTVGKTYLTADELLANNRVRFTPP